MPQGEIKLKTSMKPEEDDPSTARYINFLKEGLEKAKEYLAQ
uniref:Uncharacterized protein n=1 Tax=Salmo trutta TaxID=8032 RepID=A0A673ZSZ7_SALTR